jgi:membrane protein
VNALWSQVHEIAAETYGQWRRHRSSEMAAALAFYGAVALAALTLMALYIAAVVARDRGMRAFATGQLAHTTGTHNAQILDIILREAILRHYGWVALVVSAVVLIVAILATAMHVQEMIDVVWRPEQPEKEHPAQDARRHAGQFGIVVVLSFLLAVLLFAGAGIHGLMSRTHGLSFTMGLLYQSLDVSVSIVLITLVFLCIFAYLPPVDVPWKKVWPAALIGAILYERGQFALSIYIGQMDAKSPYADAGALLVILVWLFYSSQVVVIGADLTKVLHKRRSSN